MAESPEAEARTLVKKFAKKLEIESLPSYVKLVLGKDVAVEALTKDQATKLANAMRAKAARLGVALEGPPRGGATEKQLKYIDALVARGKVTPAMLSGYIKDYDSASSMPEQLTKQDASNLIRRLDGLSGSGKKFVDDEPP